MEICIAQKQLIFTMIGRSVKWSIDLKLKKKYDMYIISDDKPFRNNANQYDIIYFWNSMHQESKKSNGYTYLHDVWYVMNTQCMNAMRSNDVAIANQLSVISTIYIYAIYNGVISHGAYRIYNVIDKFCWKNEANFDYLLAHVTEGQPISYFDSSSLNPSSTMIGSTCDIWIDVLDQVMEQRGITIRTKINMLRNDSKYLMCGACVPYATGVGRIAQGIAYLRCCKNINSIDDTIGCKTRKEYADIYRMTDLGVLMPYHNIGIHVREFRKNINMLNNRIKNIVCNGKLYEFDKTEGLFVDYTGGHVFSQYIGRIDISNSFLLDRPDDLYEIYCMGYDDRKLCHTVFMKIIQKKIYELQQLYEEVSSHIIRGWIEYMSFELNERRKVVDSLWK